MSVPVQWRDRFPGQPARAVLVAALLFAATACGCTSSDRPSSVPKSAQSVVTHKGTEPIAFTAPQRGMVFVFDRSTHNRVYTGWLRGGETLELDAPHDEVRIDGRSVAQKDLRDANEYDVWFDPRP